MTDFIEDIEEALKVLDAGGVILYPTDTIWGLGCDATNKEAVEKLMQLKGKPLHKGLIVLLASERDVLQYTATPDLEVFDYLTSTSKPTTVIYEYGLGVADEVLNEDGSIAIRLVKEDFCRHLVKRLKKPLVSTSANFHGQPSPKSFNSIAPDIKSGVGYVVKYRQNEEFSLSASAIVKWKNGKCLIIRE
ncbi:L-threonylcarbamoyladenylate synthase [Segetibacter sp.]|jgi:L-threonylcarbamoyladenylate synthase|uniref:L-threonylcarbamoyladenylate synthase n=1 Tax=Segetibacter sp. TaxID=2231182 RepID=UPI002616BBFA|nr:L-threonylcarbamoyladenylate synthase [Segetibacter sp.]MCW3081850.1 threonylcarbamoyl-AMP synthase [Segetibacter sp.]